MRPDLGHHPPTGATFPRSYATRPPRAVLSLTNVSNIYWSSNAAMELQGGNSSTGFSNGPAGQIADLVIARGASVPSLGSDSASRLALRRAVEAYHYDLALPPGISAHYPITEGSGTTLASDIGGATSGGFAGAPTWSAAGVIATSWDAM